MDIEIKDNSQEFIRKLQNVGFSNEFIMKHTGGKFSNYIEFVSSCPSFNNGIVDDAELDKFVSDSTDFASFADMIKSAIAESIS